MERQAERVGWLDNFAESFAKRQQSKGPPDYQSLYREINSIVSGKPIYATVEDKVKDLRERAGLNEYLKRRANLNVFSDKVDLKTQEQIVNFCRNFVATHHGQIAIPAIQHEVANLFNIDSSEINSPEFVKCLNEMLTEKQRQQHSVGDKDLGKGVGVSEEEDEGGDFFKNM